MGKKKEPQVQNCLHHHQVQELGLIHQEIPQEVLQIGVLPLPSIVHHVVLPQEVPQLQVLQQEPQEVPQLRVLQQDIVLLAVIHPEVPQQC